MVFTARNAVGRSKSMVFTARIAHGRSNWRPGASGTIRGAPGTLRIMPRALQGRPGTSQGHSQDPPERPRGAPERPKNAPESSPDDFFERSNRMLVHRQLPGRFVDDFWSAAGCSDVAFAAQAQCFVRVERFSSERPRTTETSGNCPKMEPKRSPERAKSSPDGQA